MRPIVYTVKLYRDNLIDILGDVYDVMNGLPWLCTRLYRKTMSFSCRIASYNEFSCKITSETYSNGPQWIIFTTGVKCVVGGGVRAAAFTLTLFAGGGFHAMRQRLQSELNHLSAEDP